MEDLQWHMAAEAAMLSNMIPFETSTANLRKRISGLRE